MLKEFEVRIEAVTRAIHAREDYAWRDGRGISAAAAELRRERGLITVFMKPNFKSRLYVSVLVVFTFAVIAVIFGFLSFASGTEPMLNATWNHNYKQAAELINNGGDVNERDDRGRTPLMYAVQSSDHNLVSLYLRSGAKVNARDSQGRTALTWAGYTKDAKVTEMLKKAGGTF